VPQRLALPAGRRPPPIDLDRPIRTVDHRRHLTVTNASAADCAHGTPRSGTVA
jgi:hypothetical protein